LINILTLDPKYPAKIVGSYKYIVHEYPNDVDLFEEYEGCCNRQDVVRKLKKRFQSMIRDILHQPNTYLGDFKCGIDDRYDIDIGYWKGKKIYDYNPEKIKSKIREIYDEGLLTDDEVQDFLAHVMDEPTFKQYEALFEMIKNKRTVRWEAKHILNGYKKLPKNKVLKLKEALTHKSVTKIDIWTNISGRYIEVTNWYSITYMDEQLKSIQYLSEPMKDYKQSLLSDLSYYGNPEVGKQMKYAKRLWNYYAMHNKYDDMIKLYPLFNSPAAKMHQINGEVETIINIMTKVSSPDMTSIKRNIEDWKIRLGTVLEDTLPYSVSSKCFEKMNLILSTPLSASSKKTHTIELLHDISELLSEAINKSVKKYFITNDIMTKM
jgi:hypothetical protein